jgi:hypothetical protein
MTRRHLSAWEFLCFSYVKWWRSRGRAKRVTVGWLANWLAGLLIVTRSAQKKPTSEDVGWWVLLGWLLED